MPQLIIANWKMNPAKGSEARKLFKSINTTAGKLKNVETVVCPPLVYLESLGEMVTTRSCVLGAQDAFWEHIGPFTGQVSPDMVFNAKARYVIVGHSERRALGETDEMVNKKLKSILQFPLIPVLCIGELERDEDLKYIKFIKQQLKKCLDGLTAEQVSRIVVAYEPVWSISSNRGAHKRVCSPAECREVVQVMRQVLADMLGDTEAAKNMMIVYGGSVNTETIAGFLNDGLVHGALVGSASLDTKEFTTILKIADKIKK